MKINQFKKEEFPIIPTRNGLEVKQVAVDFLKSTGIGFISYGLSDGDVFEFPDTLEDAVITTRQVRKDSKNVEVLVMGLKNGKLANFSLANLRRRDADMQPVHPVSADLRNLKTDYDRLEACLGKTIVAQGTVKFKQRDYDKGLPLDTTTEKETANLVWKA